MKPDLSNLSPEQKRKLLADMLAKKANKHAETSKVDIISSTSVANSFPLSRGQKAIWLLANLNPNTPAYNFGLAFNIEGSHQSEAVLRQVLTVLTSRHAALRTVFSKPSDEYAEPTQTILPPKDAPPAGLSIVDAQDWDENKLEEAVRLAYETSFDIYDGPLFRFNVFLRKEGIVLLVSAHHLVFDAMSIAVVLGEIAALLQGSKLPPVKYGYDRFVEWQETMLNGAEGQKQKDYWLNNLAGSLPRLNLPFDFDRPAVRKMNGNSTRLDLDVETATRARELSRKAGVTLYTTLLTAWQLLLHLYSDEEDVLVGTPALGRGHSDFSTMVGYFAAPIAMRNDFSGNPTVGELLEKSWKMVRGALDHQDYPFELIVEDLNLTRDPARTPVYESLFSYHNSAGLVSISGAEKNKGGVHPYKMRQQEGQFDLALEIVDENGAFDCWLKYDTALFKSETVEKMLNHYVVVLNAMMDDIQQPISQISLLSEDEKSKLQDWNQTSVKWEEPQNLPALFQLQVDQHPTATAVHWIENDQAKSWTYQELDKEANKVGSALISAGVQIGDLVGIYMNRSGNMLAGLLGTLKIGAAYVPMDPGFPAHRIEQMVKACASDMPAILTDSSLKSKLQSLYNGKILPVDVINRDEITENASVYVDLNRADRAYVIFTSGSTGVPKGVEIPHGALANFLLTMRQKPGFTKDDVLTTITTLSFDIAGLELYLPIILGGECVILPREITMDGLALMKAIDQFKTTVMQATPATWRMLFDAGWEGKSDLKILCGGEALPRELANQLVEAGSELWNMYGPTETTIWSTIDKIEAGNTPILIGKAIANTTIEILGSNGTAVPVGAVGELCIGGDGLAIGYYGQADLTAEKFFTHFDGQRLYRTGDHARWTSDGTLQCLGRIDNQIKVRGFRIEPGDIETRLETHDAVKQAVVGAVEFRAGDTRLIAWVLTEDGQPAQTSILHDYVAEILPSYMVPSAFVTLHDVPLTPNGKVDRKALPQPDLSDMDAGGVFVAPRNQIEKTIAEVWQNLLQVDKVGIYDNFFILGGHSLLATQIVMRIQRAFEIDLPLIALFENPTVADLAVVVTENIQGGKSQLLPAVFKQFDVPETGNYETPLSFSQERMWFHEQLAPDTKAYNLIAPAKIFGKIDLNHVEEAFNEVLKQLPELRATFTSRQGVPIKTIQAFTPQKLEKFNCETDQEAQIIAKNYLHRPFDVENDTLAQVATINLDEETHVLLIRVHHLVADQWAFGVIRSVFNQAFVAISKGEAFNPPAQEISYADFVLWQREWFTDDVKEGLLSYWKDELAGISPLVLPTDKIRPADQTFKGRDISYQMDDNFLAELKQFSTENRVTFYMTMLTAFYALMHRYSRQEDIVVGTPVANRMQPAFEKLTGTFINTLVLRANITDDVTFTSLLNQVKKTSLSAFAHQDMPFEQLVEAVAPERDLSLPPLVQVMFNIQNAPVGLNAESQENARNKWESFSFERGIIQFDLNIDIEPEIQKSIRFGYNEDLFERETIQRMVDQYISILREAIRRPAAPLNQLSAITEDEKNLQFDTWNATQNEFKSATDDWENTTIVGLFEQKSNESPNKPAVIYEGDNSALTFAELNAKANQLAGFLISKGVKQGDLVGLCIDRSVNMVVGLLGIMKAGAGYVPMDPNYPAVRLVYMTEQANLAITITEESLLSVTPAPSDFVWCIDRDWADAESQSTENVNILTGSDHLAYVIFTSGSTGNPKGVAISHRALTNFLLTMQEKPGLTAADRLLGVTTISFDIFGLEIYLPLITGATLVVASQMTAGDGKRLSEAIENHQISVMQATPATWRLMLDGGWTGTQNLKVLCGGEGLPRDLADRILDKIPAGELWNMYGPTETTIWSTIHQITNDDDKILIGRPIANTTIYILDENLQPVPAGVPGTLWIGGSGLAEGYLGRQDLTDERFIENDISSTKIYNTGDLARYRKDGIIECLGRIDHQVKIRGFRIELGEVETAIKNIDTVKNAVVVAAVDHTGNNRLVGYIIYNENADDRSVESMRVRLKAALPDYMVPANFVEIDKMPLTPNGKIDRRALPKPEFSRESLATVFVEPETPYEKQLAEIWITLLSVDKVGIHDDFFTLGGHSLLATQLVARIFDNFTIEMPLRRIFETPTIEGLAKFISTEQLAEEDETEDLLSGILDLSEEELEAKLREMQGGE